MNPQKTAMRLSAPQREALIRHIDTVVPFATADLPTRVLLSRGLIKSVSGHRNIRATMLTQIGRETACALLAEYAEVLISAGFDVSPLGRLRAQTTETLETIPANRQGSDLENIDNFLQIALDNAIERRNNRVAGGAPAPLEKGPEHENRKIPL